MKDESGDKPGTDDAAGNVHIQHMTKEKRIGWYTSVGSTFKHRGTGFQRNGIDASSDP